MNLSILKKYCIYSLQIIYFEACFISGTRGVGPKLLIYTLGLDILGSNDWLVHVIV